MAGAKICSALGAEAVSRAAEPPEGTLDTAEHRGLMSNRRPSSDRPIHSARPRCSHFVAILVPAFSPRQIDVTRRDSACPWLLWLVTA